MFLVLPLIPPLVGSMEPKSFGLQIGKTKVGKVAYKMDAVVVWSSDASRLSTPKNKFSFEILTGAFDSILTHRPAKG